MSTDLIVASSTDTPEQMQAALDHVPAESSNRGIIAAVTPAPSGVVPAAASEPASPAVPAQPAEPVAGEPVVAEPVAGAPPVEGTEQTPPAAVPPPADDEVLQMGRRAQRRIHRLTAEREAANARAERAEAEVARMRGAGAPVAPAPAAGTPAGEPEPAGSVRPAAVDVEAIRAAAIAAAGAKPKADDFESHEEYVEALATYHAGIAAQVTTETSLAKERAANQAAFQQREAARAEQAREEVMDRFADSRTAAAARYPDFETTLSGAKDLPMSPVMESFVVESPVGNDIAYYLAKNPDEAKDLAALPLDQARYEMSKLEGFVERSMKTAPAPAAAAPAPAAPAAQPEGTPATVIPIIHSQPRAAAAPALAAPIQPVGGRSTGVSMSDENLPYQEWKAKRDRQEMERRRARG